MVSLDYTKDFKLKGLDVILTKIVENRHSNALEESFRSQLNEQPFNKTGEFRGRGSRIGDRT